MSTLDSITKPNRLTFIWERRNSPIIAIVVAINAQLLRRVNL